MMSKCLKLLVMSGQVLRESFIRLDGYRLSSSSWILASRNIDFDLTLEQRAKMSVFLKADKRMRTSVLHKQIFDIFR